MVPELRRRRPRHTAIDRAAQPYLDLTPVRLPVAPGFAISEQRALRRDQQAGDAVDLHAVHPERKDVGLLEGLRRQPTGQKHEDEEEASLHAPTMPRPRPLRNPKVGSGPRHDLVVLR